MENDIRFVPCGVYVDENNKKKERKEYTKIGNVWDTLNSENQKMILFRIN